jgi:hypothetical protein
LAVDSAGRISTTTAGGGSSLFSKSWISHEGYSGLDNSGDVATYGAYGWPLYGLSSGRDVRFGTILNGYDGGTLKAQIIYGAAGTGSGTVNWGVKVMCAHFDGTDQTSSSYDTENVAGTSISGGTSLRVLSQVVTLTNDDSCADGELISINVKRMSTNTFASDPWLLGVRLYEE